MFKSKGVISVTLWCTLSVGFVTSKLIVQMSRVEVINHRMDIVNATASIRRIGTRGNYVADFTVAVFKQLTDLQVTTSYYIPAFDGSLDKPIYNRTVNFCTYLRRPGTDRILQMIYEDLNRRGNLPKSCPVTIGTYSFNTSFDSFRLPGFLPESNFRFDLNFHQRREPYFDSNWFDSSFWLENFY
ncbi:LOW QUALITY PROTEIN: uncharacterized protein LOC131285419 [Anopheles ziemanni]|uniref:LOW QUALITY PROTEIN: uncharacterized protein LOC131266369 n=1 Tax=Anopheles coustani TaxID=139045 RepID=UPI00265A75D1|nr:LOW QUALITY PROTEIN: uncharacterized protein LOC131266369 [Anopheles coustani]XP_058170257.1 LOW QUALITY PROTEIN: uncharacterized protein LOC131285419 [Anopheles ziemanni]